MTDIAERLARAGHPYAIAPRLAKLIADVTRSDATMSEAMRDQLRAYVSPARAAAEADNAARAHGMMEVSDE